jgi:hypothetical protein
MKYGEDLYGKVEPCHGLYANIREMPLLTFDMPNPFD